MVEETVPMLDEPTITEDHVAHVVEESAPVVDEVPTPQSEQESVNSVAMTAEEMADAEQHRDADTIFDAIDTDGDGKLTKTEVKIYLDSMPSVLPVLFASVVPGGG